MEERKEKFTPGPWYIKPREAYETCLGTAYSRTTILDKPDGQYSPRHVIATVARGNGREEANAALLAAAPLMYEALDIILDILKNTEAFPRTVAAINEVLSIARGEAEK